MQKSFGRTPAGNRLQRILKSPQFREGSFHNVERTEMLSPDASYPKLIRDFVFGKPKDHQPSRPLPSVKTDLHKLSVHEPTLIWFGHSSYLLTLAGKVILVDPVFSQRSSPYQFVGTKAYPLTHAYRIEDFPPIDLVLLTHDHYDHLDYVSISRIHPRAKRFVAPLGVGEHLVYWGVDESKITELDWWESVEDMTGLELTATPARHFSGRGLKRNQALWTSYVMKVDGYRLFIGGDSGYDKSFKTIGDKFGPFDLAILECGQYDKQWPYIHMMPEETVQAGKDLRSKILLPVHWGKFSLANHPWYEPIERAVARAAILHQPMVTPRIGEKLNLEKMDLVEHWWEDEHFRSLRA